MFGSEHDIYNNVMIMSSSFVDGIFSQLIICVGEIFISADIQTNIKTYDFHTRLHSENKPLGTALAVAASRQISQKVVCLKIAMLKLFFTRYRT